MENNDELSQLAGAAAAADAVAAETVAPAAPEVGAVEVPQVSPDAVAAALPEAVVIADAAAGFVKTKWGVELSDPTKETGAKKLAPLLVKYDMDSPFLRKWRLEIDALIFLGATGYGVYKARQAALVEAVSDGGK